MVFFAIDVSMKVSNLKFADRNTGGSIRRMGIWNPHDYTQIKQMTEENGEIDYDELIPLITGTKAKEKIEERLRSIHAW